MKIRRAIISVSNKRGVVEFVKALQKKGVEIISTGGTANTLEEAGLKIKRVSEYTNFPEILDGRVKTLHPLIYAAILADKRNKKHMKQLGELGIQPIDLVVVNLYPFEENLKRKASKDEMIENIDIGGPTMVRAAAKNYNSVAIVVDPDDYESVIEEINETGEISLETRKKLAVKAFNLTAHYDSVIENYLANVFGSEKFRRYLNASFEKVMELRYGENPHQDGALYREVLIKEPSVVDAEQLQGKKLSYNNILDMDSALDLLREFEEPCAVIVKHNNPCGVAIDNSLLEAYRKALATDKISAFGGIVALNREVDEKLAEELTSMFLEAVIAPSYTEKALEILSKKKRLRVMKLKNFTTKRVDSLHMRSVTGGLLAQDKDNALLEGSIDHLKVVTKRKPTESEKKAMLFAWKVCKHVKSNCVLYAREDRTIGIGAGQMSRVDASLLGAMKAKNAGLDTKGTALASDAFFPFRDGVDAAAKAGVTAIIQPGGSIRDQEVIDACNEHNIAMVFTGMRHFNH